MPIIKEDNSVHCSGALVTPKLVLTAGHCFAVDSPDYIPLDKLRLVFGIDNLEDLNVPLVLEFKKIEIRIG